MTVITRFAPSPTGFLHIGGARTALFNWLFARHHGGRMLLRVEDTDRARSTEEAVEAIYDGLRWLGLDWDDEPISQFARASRHTEVAQSLLETGNAYRCYASAAELEDMRTRAKAEGRSPRYDGRWRDRAPEEAPPGVKPVVRLRAPTEGETTVNDLVQGSVTVSNETLDDMVLLRADGSPTYMLAVVVDDHDMGISHVIRGDDHFTNTFRQRQIYDLMGWQAPAFAHIPLIHGSDGAKLSKRHGALAVQAYRDMGYLPEALCNYLLRLGWSHGDDEIISSEQAIAWFDLDTVGKSPSRMDFDKLENLNAHYIRQADHGALLDEITPLLTEKLNRPPSETELARVRRGLEPLVERATTTVDLAARAWYLIAPRPLIMDDKAKALLNADASALLGRLLSDITGLAEWTKPALEAVVREFAEKESLKLGKVAQPLRAALTGQAASPGIFDVLFALGREESLARLQDAADTMQS